MGESVQRAPEGTFGAVVVNRGAHDLLRVRAAVSLLRITV